MAALNDLLDQIEDKELRNRVQQEINKLTKHKKFGLVFEEHLPECVPLFASGENNHHASIRKHQ